MSSLASLLPPVPRDTAYVAETVFATDNRYLVIGAQTEQLLAGLDLAPLDPVGGQSAWTLTMCLLVTILQYLDNLPDQRAEAATRLRPDWKYALHLPVAYPGFNYRRLCEFRRLVQQQPIARLTLQHVLDRLSALTSDLAKPAADEVLRAVCAVSCLERLIEAVHVVLEAVAVASPEWLRMIARPHWYERYDRLQMLSCLPRSTEAQTELARAINADAVYLLEALATESGPNVLPEVRNLWLEWDLQFSQSEQQLDWHGPQCAAGAASYEICSSTMLAGRSHFTS